ncbi:XRE family transcriptional regulator [Lactobacillus helveticus]|uniref:helix-turn-helix domain-containing protein n=1 Tax=Lactobacillus helveticus TaxID=1587 RepID=UPI001C1E7E71|nr:helix-turn-helix transcriptional regulator [Lactobacillus helveticus]MBU5980823.1 helix-turn-helix domain-containing protein [Lactobacillus helveticus]MCT3413257.1 XRE family transcriptional regulator [Lactobacillus helveticus]
MVYQSYNFGSKFKELRRSKGISKGISIEKVAKDITSKSHLSNWKNGKAILDITVFVKLLSRINIQPAEFFKIMRFMNYTHILMTLLKCMLI